MMALLVKILDNKKSFFLGLFSGFLVSLFIFSLGAYTLIMRGVTVEFNAEELARTISQQVRAQARVQLPQFINQAKSELPKIMAEQATEEFSRTNIQFFNVNIKLPEVALVEIKRQLEINFKDSLDSSLNNINIENMAQEVGSTSYKLTKESLEKQFNGKTFMVKTHKWVSIPVTVEIN